MRTKVKGTDWARRSVTVTGDLRYRYEAMHLLTTTLARAAARV